MGRTALERFLLRLARIQTERPWLIVALTLLTLVPAGWAASQLTLKTAFSELLPDDKASVIEMRRTRTRLPSTQTLTLVAQGKDADSLKRFVDVVSPKIRALGPDLVVAVDDGNREVQDFFRRNKHLYADLDDIQTLHDEVVERYDYEVSKAAGLDLGLDDEVPPPLDADAVERRFRKKLDEAEEASPGRDGYYLNEKGTFVAILVRTPFGAFDPRAHELRARVGRVIEEVNPRAWDPTMRFDFTGNLITGVEQHEAIVTDLAHVGMWGVGLILTVVFLFFLRLRTLLAMAVTIGVGCAWAFGLAWVTVGYLNTATGFLVSIIAGNGINFGIIFMARYIESRRDDGFDVSRAIEAAHRGTHGATLAAASAAMIAYGSLSATDFRGFKHFGVIGGAGMLLCWLATYWLLPAVLVISERVMPLSYEKGTWQARLRGVYGYPFAWMAKRFSRIVAVLGIVSGAAAAVLTYQYLAEDPTEYNLRKVRNREITKTSATKLSRRVDKVVGRLGQDGRAILTDRLDQVAPLVAKLEARSAAAPADKKPFEKVVSIFELVPKDQDAKVKLLATMKDRLERARRRGFIDADEWKKLEPHVPETLDKIGIDDLPALVARPFEEKDGTRGRIVYIVPKVGESIYDAKYLMRWADTFREVRLDSGEVIRGSGDPVIFSDMLIAVWEDAPKAIGLSFFGTLLVILVAFRGRRSGFVALATLLLGIVWLVAFLALKDIKLNFLNFVALPISIGVGADYALNVMKRHDLDGDADLDRVFVETGGAVVLCSLTTTLGYLALLISINRAVQSFGLAAAAGEITTLLAAMLVLPALLFWRQRRPKA